MCMAHIQMCRTAKRIGGPRANTKSGAPQYGLWEGGSGGTCPCWLPPSSALQKWVCVYQQKRELGHFSCYCRNCKNTFSVFKEHVYFAMGNSRVHYVKSGYVIQLIAFQWNTACIHSSPDPSLSCRNGLACKTIVYISLCNGYCSSDMSSHTLCVG